MSRQMPPEGWYVRVRVLGQPANNLSEIIHCTGTKRGNSYYRSIFRTRDFAYLIWTCVPSVREIEEDFRRFDTEEEARSFYESISILQYVPPRTV